MQPRNWRKWWHCYALHVVQGLAAGILAWHFPVSALLFFLACMFYQFAEYIRIRELEGSGDTLRRDVMDIVVGLQVGFITGATPLILASDWFKSLL